MPTPSFSRHSRTLSPPLSISSQAITIGSPQKLNIVTRLAIEGRAKHGQDGAAIKLYLKISLPLESVTPGTTLPLFPEENIKILKSQVHPIDNNSAPYNFSSTTCPLLHHAARALCLPARSSLSYLSNFGLSSTSASSTGSSSRQSASNGVNPPPLDDKYTGHILVSGYYVSYVLPKEFPRFKGSSFTDNEEDGSIRGNQLSSYKIRRSSVGDKNTIQFMAAIDMWVPYISRPPRAPYLLSIPIPRCLSNNVKLRIFPPTVSSASFASLSSAEEDGGVWDLTSDPHVTRNASARLSRTNSYSHFADDESSDSSAAGFSDGCGIQGTFPSAERIRVRWAAPPKTVNVPNGGDNRRRVGVREAKGEITCLVLGKGKDRTTDAEGIVLNIQYKGTCKGVWFPGVATLLGMDVGLESKGSDVYWAINSEQNWSVGGGLGYTGFDMTLPRKPTTDDSPPVIFLSPSSPPLPGRTSRHNSTSSTSSLLRAPLPAQNVPDYSFEGSAASSAPSGTVSSLGSLPPNSTPDLEGTASPNEDDARPRPPGVPITIHMNMNDLLPPSKNIFTFTISGTILVVPRSRPYSFNSRSSSPDADIDPEPIILPRFSVLAADTETTTILLRNEVEQGNVEVYNSTGDIRDAQTRKTVLQKGGFTRCGADGGRIALRSFRHMPSLRHRIDDGAENGRMPSARPRTPSGVASPVPLRQGYPLSMRPRRDGALMIPYVMATVTPLLGEDSGLPDAYAVRLDLPAPCDGDSEWLEFGFAQSGASSMQQASQDSPPRLKIASASVDGVPVRFETTSAAVKQEQDGLGVPFEEMGGKEWVSWVKVFVGGRGGGMVLVDYVVEKRVDDDDTIDIHRQKGKPKAKSHLDVLLPTFSLPVGRLEVNVETNFDLEISSLLSNLAHRHYFANGRRLLHYSMDELFYPRLSLIIQPSAPRPVMNNHTPNSSSNFLKLITRTAPTLLTLILLFCLIKVGSDIRQMKRSLETYSTTMGSGWDEIAEPITITTTVHASSHSKWWFGEATLSSITSATPTGSANVWSPQTVPAYQSGAGISASITTPLSEEPTQSTHPETGDLIPFINFPFPWLVDFELPTAAYAAVDKIIEGFGVVWQVFRKVYHYPLDPPL